MSDKSTVVGEKIRGARKNANLTQRELADAISVSDSFVAHCEAGFRLPSDAICLALGKEFGWNQEEQNDFLRLVEEERVERSRSRIKRRGATVRKFMEHADDAENTQANTGGKKGAKANRSARRATSDPEFDEAVQNLTSVMKDPELRPTIVSTLRHWAKTVANRPDR